MEKLFKLNNGICLDWTDAEKKDEVSTIVLKEIVETESGLTITTFYDHNGHILSVSCEKDVEVATSVATGIAETSGTFVDNRGSTKGRKSSQTSEPAGRKNAWYVYFYTRKVHGKIVYCHHHDAVASDPMGSELLKEWRRDPEAYMAAHPELCRNKNR